MSVEDEGLACSFEFSNLSLCGTQSGFINSFPFDPAGMNSPDMAVKEIKNGRLAMVRGCCDSLCTYVVTGIIPSIRGDIQ